MAKADDGTVSTDVLLQIAQILVLRLPVGPMQIVGSKWMKKFLIIEDKEKLEEFLPLFILSLKQQTLVEPFDFTPLSMDKEWDGFHSEKTEFTQNDILKSIKEDRTLKMNAPPYKIDISRDLMEYAAYQEIPNFGAHFYYAFSLEPLPNWQNFNKFRVPWKLIPTLKVVYPVDISDNEEQESLESLVLDSSESVEAVPGSITTSHVRFDPVIVQSAGRIPPVLGRLLQTTMDESIQNELDKTAQELERSERLKGIPERLHKYMRDTVSTSSPATTRTPSTTRTPAITRTSATETEEKDDDDQNDLILEDKINEKMRRIALASQSPICKTRAQELKTRLHAIKTRKEEAILIPEVVIEPSAIEEIDIFQLPQEFLDASESLKTVAQMATTEIQRINMNQTPDLATSDYIVTATDNVGHQILDAFHSTDGIDLNNVVITAVEILDKTIENRNLIQMVAGPSITVDTETTRQLEEIRENLAETEQQIEAAEEIMDEPITSEEENANKSQILEQIKEAIVVCKEDQVLLESSIPEDESSAKYVSLLSGNNNAAIKELVNVQDIVLIDFETDLPTFIPTDQIDIKNTALSALEILDETIKNRNLIQMLAAPSITVDTETTRQLEEIRENLAETEQQIEAADEIMDESNTSEEYSANKSHILEQINEAIVVCKEEQELLERSIPEDESSAKYVLLLSTSNNAAIEDLESVTINHTPDFDTGDFVVTATDQADQETDYNKKIVDILKKAIEERIRIQKLDSIIVDPKTMQKLQEIRKSLGTAQQELPAQLTAPEIKYFRKLKKILKLIQQIIDDCSNADEKLEKQMKGKKSIEYSEHKNMSSQFITKMKKLLFKINDSNPKDSNFPNLIGDLTEQGSVDLEVYTDTFEGSKNQYIEENQDDKFEMIMNFHRELTKNLESFQEASILFLEEVESAKNTRLLTVINEVVSLVRDENVQLESFNQDESNEYASMLSESNNATMEELEYFLDVLSYKPAYLDYLES